ncbi:MAG: ABC transporter permease [Thermoplasmata archaeon]|nr:ABC transporter permease [Thermoplasmata archaeon]
MSAKNSSPSTPKKIYTLNEVRAEKLRLLTTRTLDVIKMVVNNPMGLSGVLILTLFGMLTIFGPAIAPYDTSNLGLGKWRLPSEFATDPPPLFQYLTLLIPGVAGLVVSTIALMAAFIRVKSWKRLNKWLQIAAIAASFTLVLLVSVDYLGYMDIGGPWWLYVLSVTGISVAMLSLGTRRRANTNRRRAQLVGIVGSLLPLLILAIPAVVELGSSDLPLFYLGAYTISGFSYAIAGAGFMKAYRKPPSVVTRLVAEGKMPKTSMPTRIVSLAKMFSLIAALAAIITGLMAYMAGNWTTHWMGTDTFGADIFSELLYGARTSMIVGIFSAIIASVLGALVGLYSGYVGGWVDEIIMRANDVVLSIPWLVLMIIVAAMIGKIDLLGLILIIGLTGWSPTARMVRAQVMSIRERQYIERARAIGSSDLGIIRRHVFPNSFPLVFANTILTVAVSILSEATLSFLGMRPIGVVTWGTMLSYSSDANAFSIGLHWWIIAPGLCIVAVVLGFTLLGYALDDILNPKLRKR